MPDAPVRATQRLSAMGTLLQIRPGQQAGDNQAVDRAKKQRRRDQYRQEQKDAVVRNQPGPHEEQLSAKMGHGRQHAQADRPEPAPRQMARRTEHQQAAYGTAERE